MENLSKIKSYLSDYKKPFFSIDGIHLYFDIKDTEVIVTQTAKYRLEAQDAIHADLILDGVNLELISLKINGAFLKDTYKIENNTLTIPHFFSESSSVQLEIVNKINPYTNKSLEGLYQSSDYLVTQCEAQGFRKITYYPDRPDIMTKFTVSIEADKTQFPILLSNGDLHSTQQLENNRQLVVWIDPWKKPCYLFALFAGNLGVIQDSFKTRSGKKVELKIYAPHGKQDRCWHAMESLKKSMEWDEKVFGREYDLSNYLIVATDDFNAGAMENKGLNIFNSRLVLADNKTATDNDFFNIESVVAHEYFHNWTGNRITLRDWFQLSLKEGLTVFRDQEFSADMTEKGIQRIKDIETLKDRQFPEDAGPNAHPVRPESCYSVDNFFTATIYEKGAEVIRMMKNLIGQKKFLAAMDRYFSKYDGMAITTDDFRTTILDESGFDSSLFKKWYEIPGTPKVKIEEIYNSKTNEYTLLLTQAGETFQIPIFIEIFDRNGQILTVDTTDLEINSDGQKLINLKTNSQKVILKNLTEKPVVSLLRNFSAPIILEWDRPMEDLITLSRFDNDTFNKKESFHKLYLILSKQIYLDIKKHSIEINNSELMAIMDQIKKVNIHTYNLFQNYCQLFGELLKNNQIEISIKAKLFQNISAQSIVQEIGTIDALLMTEIQNQLRYFLSLTYKELYLNELKGINSWLETNSSNGYSFKAASYREFKGYIEMSLSLIKAQFKHTVSNFTEELNKFNSDIHSQNRAIAIENFYSKWKSESLVINKWMQLIAEGSHSDTFNDIKKIYNSDRFNKENPNQVYSLLRAFGNNLFYFHSNPEHYDFLMDQIIEIDKFNPQVAARVCSTLQVIEKLETNNKFALKEKIKIAIKKHNFSSNSFELLEKLI